MILSPNPELYDELGRPINRNWFSPPWMPEQQEPQQSQTPALASPIATAVTPIYQPASLTPVEEEYFRHLNAMPQRTSPGKLQRVLAAIAGGTEGYLKASPSAGVAAAEGILEAPYQRRLAGWNERLAALKPQVELMGELHKRGVDISKLGLGERELDIHEAGQLLNLEAALARVAETAQGRAATERYRQAQLNLNERKFSSEAARNAALDKAKNDYYQEMVRIRNRLASAAELRARKTGRVKSPQEIEAEAYARTKGTSRAQAEFPKPTSELEKTRALLRAAEELRSSDPEVAKYIAQDSDKQGTFYRLKRIDEVEPQYHADLERARLRVYQRAGIPLFSITPIEEEEE